MKHTPTSAALAARSILENTSRIPKTPEDMRDRWEHIQKLPPAQRPGDTVWANAYQAYRLAKEQLCGPSGTLTEQQDGELQDAIATAMPELFAEYWT